MKNIAELRGYEATESGSIISIRSGYARVLKPRMHKGYLHVFVKDINPYGQTIRKKEPIHKLILLAFHGPKPGIEYQCRHLNGNPLDNRPENLCWGTPKENVHDSIIHGTAACLRFGERSNCAKLKDKEVDEIRCALSRGKKQVDIANRYGVNQKHISDIKLNRTRVPRGGVTSPGLFRC